jgi:RimJ/RimL family protein N-acetyltransferase
MTFEPVVLEGKHVRLESLGEQHKEGVCRAISDGELWNLFVTIVPHPDDIDQFLAKAKSAHERGEGLAFATIAKGGNDQVAGSTRFMAANLANNRVEIGFTFLGKTWQRSPINTEAKLLMLTHAFESLELSRVELMTDYLNTTSRQAILRLGANGEGVLRNHMVMPGGRARGSVVYSS